MQHAVCQIPLLGNRGSVCGGSDCEAVALHSGIGCTMDAGTMWHNGALHSNIGCTMDGRQFQFYSQSHTAGTACTSKGQR
eukprot:1139507-Pelagomonas_calceolata.AAC.7